MAEGLRSQVVKLQQMVDQLWRVANVQKESEAFTPSAKNPFLRKTSRIATMYQSPVVAHTLYNPQRAFVIDTRDPYRKGRVQIFCPMVHANIPEQDLPWAEKIEPFGSLEDHGSVFTPSAGSTVLVVFESGFREAPLIMGCIWNVTRDRSSGAEGGLMMIEERKLWGGAPGKRTDAKNQQTNSDPKYLMPPWNNESYNGKDLGSGTKSAPQYAPTTPNIYGIKTPQKHFLQFVDGDHLRKLWGKRVVLQTSRGSCLWMKDDALRKPDKLFENKMWDDHKDAYPGLKYPKAKPFNRHTIELKHTGIQLQSFGGHRLVLSDETEKDWSSNEWSDSYQPKGKMRSFVTIQSISEHKMLLNDWEKKEGIRGWKDGCFMVTATGHYFGMQDDSLQSMAGRKRAIILHSTSGHKLELNDYTAKVVRPRKGDGTVYHGTGTHKPTARKAWVKLSSGWGQWVELNDLGSQEKNARQYILIRNQNDDQKYECEDVGPPWNFIRMNCVTNNRRFVIWGAGTFMIHVCRQALRIIEKKNDFVGVKKGNKMVRVFEGRIWERAEVGIVHWTTFNRIKLMVGRIINKRLEFPIHPVVLAFKFWRCPLTGHVHCDRWSRHVFASE